MNRPMMIMTIRGLFSKGINMKLSLLSKEQMEKLSTKRLLAYKAKLLTVRDWVKCYCGDDGCKVGSDEEPNAFTKQHPSWQELYMNVKIVLATREHVER